MKLLIHGRDVLESSNSFKE